MPNKWVRFVNTVKRTLVLALAWLSAAGVGRALPQKDKVAPSVPMGAEPFALEEVRLLDGPFRHAMEMDCAYLLSLEPDRIIGSSTSPASIQPTRHRVS
jgi:hypothetical protein